MATVTKSTLKTYFEQGDIPTQAQYVDLIDSQLNLSEVGTQVIQGNISTNSAEIDYVSLKKLYIPGIGVSQDASPREGMKVGSSFTIGKSLEVVGDVNVTGNISGSNINSSGTITSTGGFVGNFTGNSNTATLATNATNLTGLTTTVAELNHLDGITANEATQIKNINNLSISSAEWGYVASNNQLLSTNTRPTFRGVSITKTNLTAVDVGATYTDEGGSGGFEFAIPSMDPGLAVLVATINFPESGLTSVFSGTTNIPGMMVFGVNQSVDKIMVFIVNLTSSGMGGGTAQVRYTIS